MVKTKGRLPTGQEALRRIIPRSPLHSQLFFNFGPWEGDQVMFTQYWWKNGTDFPNSSMTSLRLLQNKARAAKHLTITKWETELGRMVPEDVWQATWLPK